MSCLYETPLIIFVEKANKQQAGIMKTYLGFYIVSIFLQGGLYNFSFIQER